MMKLRVRRVIYVAIVCGAGVLGACDKQAPESAARTTSDDQNVTLKTAAPTPHDAGAKKPFRDPEAPPLVGWTAIPRAMQEGGSYQRKRFAELLAMHPLPAIDATEWLNSEPLSLEALKGKVVLLDFWGTWCVPCLQAIPETNALHEKYAAQGLVIIGVCHTRNAELMSQVVEERGISYPVCADRDYVTTDTYKVDGYPDYYLIDRSGRLRLPDCSNELVEDAVKLLLAEQLPDATSP